MLVRVQTGTATLENRTAFPQEAGDQSTLRSNYNTLGHTLKGHFPLLWTFAHPSLLLLLINSLHVPQWTNDGETMPHLHSEYYPAVKKNGIYGQMDGARNGCPE